ncbi:DENN domain-containing protein 5B isoform X4 [Octopus bimaculoides]|uniref:DENN domain-containing protein 5B isoform X4 n=1 Tax=Octopus bimaculoides TaxID=37653 RepID=UPI0022E8B071|nr:DENN domain-containing protein 5B isoform X4 [Octopus bimaculoides]
MTGQGPSYRFADYFVICGLDVDSGLEPDTLSGDNLHCAPLRRPYKSKVLAHYPETVPWNPFDKEAVGMLCLPKGLSFRTQSQPKSPHFHSFMITKEDGSRTYGAVYVFYEEVENEQICAAMQTLQAMHHAELSNDQSRTLYPELESTFDQSPMTMRKSRPRPHTIYDINNDKLYVTKGIALISQLPFVSATRQFLKQLHDAVSNQKERKLPLECYVYNVLYEVPLPPPGRSMKFFGTSLPIFCQRPGMNELPLFDFSLWELFQLLDSRNILRIFRSILLEHQVLFYSSDYQRLMLVAEALCTLIFPFTWQHVYVPILPASLSHFLDAPVPFIMGLHHGQEDRSELKLPSEASMCFVDIDENNVDIPEDLPLFPHQKDMILELSALLSRYRSEFSKDNYTSQSLDRKLLYGSRKGGGQRKQSASSLFSDQHSWNTSPEKKWEMLQNNEAWVKISTLAKKAGVWDSFDDPSDNNRNKDSMSQTLTKDVSVMPSKELIEHKFNSAVREVFLNRFVHMFCSYESFVIPSSQNMEQWLSNREMMQNFDKAAFLSDQPEAYLPFLSPFIETQMFTTLIDNKILSQWESPDPYLKVFDNRVKLFKEKSGEAHTPTYYPCETIQSSEPYLEKRASFIDLAAQKPHLPDEQLLQSCKQKDGFQKLTFGINGRFPQLQENLLNTEPKNQKTRMQEAAKWRRKDRHLQHSEHIQLTPEQREKCMQEAHSIIIRNPKLSDMSKSAMAQRNWQFVETLLKECRTKTKRMLVEKMGQEAVELGHGEVNITGVEENTLIASLCDLLERIWSHGLLTKKGKSAFWSHMLSFLELETIIDAGKPIDPKLLTPAATAGSLQVAATQMVTLVPGLLQNSTNLMNYLTPPVADFHAGNAVSAEGEKEKPAAPTHRRSRSKGGTELPMLKPLPKSLTFDVKKVKQMTDIKTDVGFARAFVRLALEKKTLSAHLKELLSDAKLLQSLYKRYAFMRCEEEREQFLYHLLSLNAVDYFCFTNTFTNTIVPYKVLIYPSTKFGCFTTSANPWISLAGQIGETGVIEIPKGCLEYTSEHKNLGILTTLRIGHDNSGMSPKWLVEYVLVRNEITGHLFKFPCGKWLGRVDDGSTERLLVGELVHSTTENEADMGSLSRTPPRCMSPAPTGSPRHKLLEHSLTIPEIQEMLGHAVNNIVKHYHKPEKERGNITYLLCGENGLVQCIECVFKCGFKSARLFRHKFFAWDYLERVKCCFETFLDCPESLPPAATTEQARAGYLNFCKLIKQINDTSSESIGKDGRFQLFICFGIRDSLLQQWLPLMANTTVTTQMYEENSFLRNVTAMSFLVHILDTLVDYNVCLESSVTRGLDI